VRAGWQAKPLSEFADCCLGKMLDKTKNRGTPQPYLRNVNVRWFGFDLRDVLEMRFEAQERERYTARKGDLLICEGGYPGRAAIWEHEEPIHFQKAVHRVRFHDPERARWVLYYLWASDADGSLRRHFTGSGIQHFTGQALARLKIPLPPLDEQRRTLAVLDQAFAAIATATANAEKNLANVQELFSSVVSSALRPSLDGLRPMRFGDFCQLQRGFDLPTQVRRPGSVPLVSSSGVIDAVDRAMVSGPGVITGRSGSIGNVFFETADFWPLNTTLYVKDFYGNAPRFVYHFLRAFDLSRYATGAGVPTLNKNFVNDAVIWVPNVEIQQRLANSFDQVESEVEGVSRTYEKKIAELERLKQSLLHRAFSGQLTEREAIAA